MEYWKITGFFTILILGFLLMSGCTSTGTTGTNSQPTATSMIVIATTAIPTNPVTISTTAVPTKSIIPTASITPQVYSSNDINKHFVDIAFGPDYSWISKWNKEFVDVGISGTFNDADVIMLNNFTKLFNSYSTYTKLSSEITKERMTANIVLRFMPESSLKNINSDNSWKISKNRETDTINYIYKDTGGVRSNSETIYINSDLKGNARTHMILRALLYELGFPGETGNYPDSIFYSDSNAITSLSKIDLKTLELMYGKKISNGMTLTKVRDLLLIDNK